MINFLPNSEDTSLEAIMDSVERWMKERLLHSLARAKDLLSNSLRPAILEALSTACTSPTLAIYSRTHVEAVAAAMRTVLERRCDELLAWFETPSSTQQSSLTFGEVKLAVDGRFRSEVERGKLRIDLATPDAMDVRKIDPDNVRLVFDIWCELAKNALKYSGLEQAVLKVRSYDIPGERGYMFSATRKPTTDQWTTGFPGTPTVTTTAAVFTSGNSGLPKVAHLAASVAGAPVEVVASSRPRWFHVRVPLQTKKRSTEN
jgi:hypothetical protein